MKKRILIIVLAMVMLFSGILMACKDKPGAEISLTVKDDSNVPEPVYSAAIVTALNDSLFGLLSELNEMDDAELKADIKEAVDEIIMPILKKAKVSEKNVKAINKYLVDSKSEMVKLFETMNGEDMPSDMEAYYTSYYSILRGAFNVLDADDVGKIMFAAVQFEDAVWYDEEVADLAKEIGRDNFIIVSRFTFKLMDVSLSKQQEMIGMMSSMSMFLITGDFDEMDAAIPYAEIVELYIMDIQMMYDVYQTITDKEIAKLVEIAADSYAAIYKMNEGTPMTAADKNTFKSTIEKSVALYRPIVTLEYKISKRVDKAKLVKYLEDEDETIANYLITVALESLEKDLSAAERTKIVDFLKTVLTNAQYYAEKRVIDYSYEYYMYYDYENEEPVYGLATIYDVVMEKQNSKQFTIPAEYLSDPLLLIKEYNVLLEKGFKNDDNLTEKEEALIELIEEYSTQIMVAFAVEFGGSPEMFADYAYDYSDEPIAKELYLS